MTKGSERGHLVSGRWCRGRIEADGGECNWGPGGFEGTCWSQGGAIQ